MSLESVILEKIYEKYGKPDGTLFDISIAWRGELEKLVKAVLEVVKENPSLLAPVVSAGAVNRKEKGEDDGCIHSADRQSRS